MQYYKYFSVDITPQFILAGLIIPVTFLPPVRYIMMLHHMYSLHK